MKNNISILIMMTMLCLSLSAQNIYIHKTDGNTIDIPLSQIEKITFTGGSGNTITDIDGNVYNIVKIGSQWWMADNLKTTKYNDGTPIPLKTDDDSWKTTNQDSPAYCWYDNNISNKNPYGALYNYYALDPEKNGEKNVCPEGWKVPTDEDWTVLTDHLGGPSVAGGKMKATGTDYWQTPNTGATNESGFTGLPGGSRVNSDFVEIGKHGRWWSSTLHPTFGSVYFRQLSHHVVTAQRHDLSQYQGFSVRCIQD